MIGWLAVLVVAIVLVIQVIPVERNVSTVPPGQSFEKTEKVPANVAAILKVSCYDCHSNETKYPWYSNISPTSWWVKNHINEGRKHLNFSTFAVYEPQRQLHKLEECIEMVEKKEMPLESYYLGHQNAKLSDEQRADLIQYFKKVKDDTERGIMFNK